MALHAGDGTEKLSCGLIAPLINARRHQVYAGVWNVRNKVAECAEKQYMMEELLEILKGKCSSGEGKVLFTGDGADAYGNIIKDTMPAGSFAIADEGVRYQHSEAVASIALLKAVKGKTVTYNGLLPEYMRLAEAEQRFRDGTLSDRIKAPAGSGRA